MTLHAHAVPLPAARAPAALERRAPANLERGSARQARKQVARTYLESSLARQARKRGFKLFRLAPPGGKCGGTFGHQMAKTGVTLNVTSILTVWWPESASHFSAAARAHVDPARITPARVAVRVPRAEPARTR